MKNNSLPLCPKKPAAEKGNVLFLVLIAVALFGALSYAITKSGGAGGASVSKEQVKLDAALAEQCVGYVERGVSMLKLVNNCSIDQISYELPGGGNANPAAPADGSCHVFRTTGAGITACGPWLTVTSCDLTALVLGEKCAADDIVYIGTAGGNRIYTTVADQGQATWNNGSGNWIVTGATSNTDGLANTNTLLALADAASPYAAAVMCRALGAEWYLPAKAEQNLLWLARNTGAINDTLDETGTWYWSSTEDISFGSFVQQFLTGPQNGAFKNETWKVRCVRR